MGCRSSDKPKPKHRKGLWSPEEDQKLRNYVLKHGHGCWSSVPINAGLRRNGKSCRLRWINYLRPGLKRGTFSLQEEETILNLHRLLGNKWSQMAQHLPGRTDNEIKNYWHSHLKKKIHKADHGVLEEPNVHDTSSDNLESNNTDQSVVQLSDHSPKKAYRSSLPKLMFAEWLSLDSFSSLNEPIMGSLDQNNSRFQDNFMQGCVLNEGTFCNSEFHNSISDASAEEMFSSKFRFEWESSGNDQFVDFGSGEDICSEFTVNNDLMFIQNYKH